MEEKDRKVLIQRNLPYNRDIVWKALADPVHANNWCGPDGFHNENVSMDFRVGGVWSFDMIGPGGKRYPNHSVFTEITPPSKIVYDHGDGKNFWFEMSITLTETPSGTLISLRHLFPTKEFRDHVVQTANAIEGGEQHLSKLEAYIKKHLH